MQKLSYLLGTLAIAALLGLGYTVLLLNSSIDRFENVVDGLQKLGAPANFIATPATTSPRNFSFTVGTSTPRGIYGTSTLAAYGSTTIQTPIDTLYAFQVFNAATTSVFDIDTINDRASTTALVISGINGSTQCLQIDADGDVTGFGSGCGGAFPFTVHADGVSTSTRLVFGNGFISQASSTVFGGLSVDNGTTTNATSTNLNVSGQVDFDTLTSALILTGAGGLLAEYTGADCTNQFIRDLSALGAPTCATIVGADVDLADLTATDSTLTFSGAYDGQTARTVGINLGNANTWTALQTINHATTTNLTVGTYFAPATDDGAPLGSSAMKWSDLFLASGSVINWNSGDLTLTHAANLLTLTGGGFTMDGAFINSDGTLEIPNGTAPVVDAVGELAIDTTENELLYATSTVAGAPAVIKPYEVKGFAHSSTTQGSGTSSLPFFTAPPNSAGYFDSVWCNATSSTATNAFMRVLLRDDAGNRMNDLVASSTIGVVKLTTNNSFTAGEKMWGDVGTTTSSGLPLLKVACHVKVFWTRN